MEAVGEAASAASPEAAPAISIATKFAETIGAMNEDDYELRYDLTLSPVGPFAKYTINKKCDYSPKWKDPSDPNKQIVEPAQREGRKASIVTPLRTGSFVIFKRELETRLEAKRQNQENIGDNFAAVDWSLIEMDYTAESLVEPVRLEEKVENAIIPYKRYLIDEQSKTNDEGERKSIESQLEIVAELLEHKATLGLKNGFVEYVLKYQGGYFYRITSGIGLGFWIPKLTRDEEQLINRALKINFRNGAMYKVVCNTGPNKGLTIGECIGRRELLRDKTHLVFSVVSGLPLGVSPEIMRATSSSDEQRLKELLATPPDGVVLSDLTQRVDEVATTVNTMIKKRRYVELAARRVTRDPEFRCSLDYPLYWIDLLEEEAIKPENNQEKEWSNAVALNASILSTLSDLIVNLPVVEGDDVNRIAAIKGLTRSNFEEPTSDDHRLFRIKTCVVQNLTGSGDSQ